MTLTNDIITSLGINLNDSKAAALMEHFESTLQERIGLEIFDSLDDEQAEKLIALQQSGKNEEAAAFIKKNVPDFEEIVQDETDILLGELADSAAAFAA